MAVLSPEQKKALRTLQSELERECNDKSARQAYTLSRLWDLWLLQNFSHDADSNSTATGRATRGTSQAIREQWSAFKSGYHSYVIEPEVTAENLAVLNACLEVMKAWVSKKSLKVTIPPIEVHPVIEEVSQPEGKEGRQLCLALDMAKTGQVTVIPWRNDKSDNWCSVIVDKRAEMPRLQFYSPNKYAGNKREALPHSLKDFLTTHTEWKIDGIVCIKPKTSKPTGMSRQKPYWVAAAIDSFLVDVSTKDRSDITNVRRNAFITQEETVNRRAEELDTTSVKVIPSAQVSAPPEAKTQSERNQHLLARAINRGGLLGSIAKILSKLDTRKEAVDGKYERADNQERMSVLKLRHQLLQFLKRQTWLSQKKVKEKVSTPEDREKLLDTLSEQALAPAEHLHMKHSLHGDYSSGHENQVFTHPHHEADLSQQLGSGFNVMLQITQFFNALYNYVKETSERRWLNFIHFFSSFVLFGSGLVAMVAYVLPSPLVTGAFPALGIASGMMLAPIIMTAGFMIRSIIDLVKLTISLINYFRCDASSPIERSKYLTEAMANLASLAFNATLGFFTAISALAVSGSLGAFGFAQFLPLGLVAASPHVALAIVGVTCAYLLYSRGPALFDAVWDYWLRTFNAWKQGEGRWGLGLLLIPLTVAALVVTALTGFPKLFCLDSIKKYQALIKEGGLASVGYAFLWCLSWLTVVPFIQLAVNAIQEKWQQYCDKKALVEVAQEANLTESEVKAAETNWEKAIEVAELSQQVQATSQELAQESELSEKILDLTEFQVNTELGERLQSYLIKKKDEGKEGTIKHSIALKLLHAAYEFDQIEGTDRFDNFVFNPSLLQVHDLEFGRNRNDLFNSSIKQSELTEIFIKLKKQLTADISARPANYLESIKMTINYKLHSMENTFWPGHEAKKAALQTALKLLEPHEGASIAVLKQNLGKIRELMTQDPAVTLSTHKMSETVTALGYVELYLKGKLELQPKHDELSQTHSRIKAKIAIDKAELDKVNRSLQQLKQGLGNELENFTTLYDQLTETIAAPQLENDQGAAKLMTAFSDFSGLLGVKAEPMLRASTIARLQKWLTESQVSLMKMEKVALELVAKAETSSKTAVPSAIETQVTQAEESSWLVVRGAKGLWSMFSNLLPGKSDTPAQQTEQVKKPDEEVQQDEAEKGSLVTIRAKLAEVNQAAAILTNLQAQLEVYEVNQRQGSVLEEETNSLTQKVRSIEREIEDVHCKLAVSKSRDGSDHSSAPATVPGEVGGLVVSAYEQGLSTSGNSSEGSSVKTNRHGRSTPSASADELDVESDNESGETPALFSPRNG